MTSDAAPAHLPPLLNVTLDMPVPSGEILKAARVAAGLSQAQAAELMGYPLQTGSRGGLQSRTWQALESTSDERNMQGPVFAMFLLLTGQHPVLRLAPREEAPPAAGTALAAGAAPSLSASVPPPAGPPSASAAEAP